MDKRQKILEILKREINVGECYLKIVADYIYEAIEEKCECDHTTTKTICVNCGREV